jgi:hypothetical protein
MATQPIPAITDWFDEPAAARVIAQIDRADFKFDFHRNFIRAGGERAWIPETVRGFEVEEQLDELRSAFLARQTGIVVDETTSEDDFMAVLAASKLQATVGEVIAAALRGHGHLGWRAA